MLWCLGSGHNNYCHRCLSLWYFSSHSVSRCSPLPADHLPLLLFGYYSLTLSIHSSSFCHSLTPTNWPIFFLFSLTHSSSFSHPPTLSPTVPSLTRSNPHPTLAESLIIILHTLSVTYSFTLTSCSFPSHYTAFTPTDLFLASPYRLCSHLKHLRLDSLTFRLVFLSLLQVSFDGICFRAVWCALIWSHLECIWSGFVCCGVILFEFVWSGVLSFGLNWMPLVSFNLVWFSLI